MKSSVLFVIAVSVCVSVFVLSADQASAADAEETENQYTFSSETDTVMVEVSSITEIIERMNGATEPTMKVCVGDCSVVFDNEALMNLTDAEMSISELGADEKEEMRGLVGDSTVYRIDFGPNTDFGDGKATVTVPCTLENWWEPENLKIWYIDRDSYEEIPCTYSDGYVTFETGHFSDYALIYADPEIVRAASTASLLIATFVFVIAVIMAYAYQRER